VEPIVFDVDDFCNKWMCLDSLFKLKAHYRKFKATLFVIPLQTNPGLFEELADIQWLELAMHGFNHEPNKELEAYRTQKNIDEIMSKAFELYQFWGFKAPGWHITKEAIQSCNDMGMWVALHQNDVALGSLCEHGYYICGDRFQYWHGHTHDVCGNWIDAKVEEILKLWPENQEFMFVSGGVKKNFYK